MRPMKWVRLGGGILLVLVGIAGCFLPILPGWVFILAGLALLAPDYPPAHRLLERLKELMKRHRHEERK